MGGAPVGGRRAGAARRAVAAARRFARPGRWRAAHSRCRSHGRVPCARSASERLASRREMVFSCTPRAAAAAAAPSSMCLWRAPTPAPVAAATSAALARFADVLAIANPTECRRGRRDTSRGSQTLAVGAHPGSRRNADRSLTICERGRTVIDHQILEALCSAKRTSSSPSLTAAAPGSIRAAAARSANVR